MANFTQAAILRTFEDMLDRMSFERITVSALVRECGVSRNTFYYHYSDIYALLDHWVSQCLRGYDIPEGDDWQERIKAILYACRDNKRRVYHIYHSLSRDRLEHYVFKRAEENVLRHILHQAQGREFPAERLRAFSNVFCYAVYGFFLRFLWNEMNNDIDNEVAHLGAVFDEILRKTFPDTNERPRADRRGDTGETAQHSGTSA